MSLFVPFQAIANTVHRRVCPLYAPTTEDQIEVIGTAVPFQLGRSALLITAAHVCMEEKARGCTAFTWGRDGPVALRGVRLLWEPSPKVDLDLALIHLDPDEAAELTGCYDFHRPRVLR